MENSVDLKKLHILCLLLADELKRICEKHAIPYFMIAGTLLGAVRHGGFIPWDDDMDFGMKRNDFERFLKIAPIELDPEKFVFQTEENDKYYPLGFAKIGLYGTHLAQEGIGKKQKQQPVFVDIFPFDNVPDSENRREALYKRYLFTRKLLRVKCDYGYDQSKQTLAYKLVKCVVTLLPVGFLKKTKKAMITKYNKTASAFCVTADGAYGPRKETLRTEWIEAYRDYDFDGHIYPGIADYDAYLSYFYGDYMTPPPPSAQKIHARSIDFGHWEDFLKEEETRTDR